MVYKVILFYDALEGSLFLMNPVIIEKLNEVHLEKH